MRVIVIFYAYSKKELVGPRAMYVNDEYDWSPSLPASATAASTGECSLLSLL